MVPVETPIASSFHFCCPLFTLHTSYSSALPQHAGSLFTTSALLCAKTREILDLLSETPTQLSSTQIGTPSSQSLVPDVLNLDEAMTMMTTVQGRLGNTTNLRRLARIKSFLPSAFAHKPKSTLSWNKLREQSSSLPPRIGERNPGGI
ncbi:unnamed protein product [Protopolystoma xenopodis]|uniref:Uncharacterized protein n=1 Tax=Protopolystoma xenopodis TaxID=117903 RepID=A0A3S4ZWS7_9PLAT|nr:unnamed protein product [Protopolystoma xenopodis]